MSPKTLFIGFQLIAGSCDSVTGLLLIVSPTFAIRMMGLREPVAEPILISFIGAFVLAIGASYLMFAAPPRNAIEVARVTTAWLITAVIRLSVGTFVLAACLAHRLELAWLTVSLVDLTIAGLQLIARRKWAASFV